MNQQDFNLVILELAHQLQITPEVKCDNKQFINAFKLAAQYQPINIQLMIKNTIEEIIISG